MIWNTYFFHALYLSRAFSSRSDCFITPFEVMGIGLVIILHLFNGINFTTAEKPKLIIFFRERLRAGLQPEVLSNLLGLSLVLEDWGEEMPQLAQTLTEALSKRGLPRLGATQEGLVLRLRISAPPRQGPRLPRAQPPRAMLLKRDPYQRGRL